MVDFGSLMQRSDSWLHFALGAASAVTSPYAVAAYGAAQVVGAFDNGGGGSGCPNSVLQGAEYGLGYFAILLAFQTYTSLSY